MQHTLVPCWPVQYIFNPKCSTIHQRNALFDPVLELWRAFTRIRIIIVAVCDLLNFCFGGSLALLVLAILHVFGSDKGALKVSLCSSIPHAICMPI